MAASTTVTSDGFFFLRHFKLILCARTLCVPPQVQSERSMKGKVKLTECAYSVQLPGPQKETKQTWQRNNRSLGKWILVLLHHSQSRLIGRE